METAGCAASPPPSSEIPIYSSKYQKKITSSQAQPSISLTFHLWPSNYKFHLVLYSALNNLASK